MTVTEILKTLEPYTGKFPREAVRAAIEQREAITPELVRVLESVAAAPAEWAGREKNMLPVFVIYLLAQFRERAAYPLLVQILGAPGEIPYKLFGGTITEGMCGILASVYDGNPAPLRGVVESEQVDEFVRSAALDTFLVLAHTGQMPRTEVVDYFRSLFQGKLERTQSFAWDGLVCAVADLPAPELLEEVRWAYAEDLVDPTVADLEGIERDMMAPEPWRQERYCLVTDAIAEMEGWAAFHPEESRPQPEPQLAKLEAPLPAPDIASQPVLSQPYVRAPKVGRNDPCPCGSGKKYKKVLREGLRRRLVSV